MLKVTMPKKRRKLNVTITTPVLPFPKVRVEWIDILSDSGWASDKEFDKMKLSFPINEGWLYNKDRYAIKLFASYDKDDDGTFTFGDRTMIPISVVKKIQKIQ
jgi:hypothetical protein